MNDEEFARLLAKAREEKAGTMISQVAPGLEARVLDRLQSRDIWPGLTLLFGGATAACVGWAAIALIGFSDTLATEAWNWMLIL